MKVVIGSINPVKINAVKDAFEKLFPNETWNVEGVKVESEISDQPMSHADSILGAKNRAKNALKKISADFGVGLEGGIQKIGNNYFTAGWAAVIDTHGTIGVGASISMNVPDKIMKMVLEGKELGEANDLHFKTDNIKQKEGLFGIMTDNAITRTHGYRDGVISALSRFLHPEIF